MSKKLYRNNKNRYYYERKRQRRSEGMVPRDRLAAAAETLWDKLTDVNYVQPPAHLYCFFEHHLKHLYRGKLPALVEMEKIEEAFDLAIRDIASTVDV